MRNKDIVVLAINETRMDDSMPIGLITLKYSLIFNRRFDQSDVLL